MNRKRQPAPTKLVETRETIETFGTVARVCWSPQARVYWLEGPENNFSSPNRGDIVKMLASMGIEWKPWEVKMK